MAHTAHCSQPSNFPIDIPIKSIQYFLLVKIQFSSETYQIKKQMDCEHHVDFKEISFEMFYFLEVFIALFINSTLSI